MKDLKFCDQSILNEDDFNDFLEELHDVKIRYKDVGNTNSEKDIEIGDFLDIFEDSHIEENLSHVFVLTLKLIEFIRNKDNKDSFLKNIFFGSVTTEDIRLLLIDTEDFLRQIVSLLYDESITAKMLKEKWTMGRIIELEDKGEPLINSQIAHLADFAYVIKEYKNKTASHIVLDAKYNLNSQRTRKTVRDSVACFVLMIVWDKFDVIYEALDKNDAFTSEEVAKEGEKILDSYVEKLRNKQLDIINHKIYNSEETKGLEKIIDVKLKYYKNNEDEDEDSDDSYIIAKELLENQKEHFSLLAGESGSGKTTMLAYMIHKAIMSWEQDKENQPLPIKIELKNIKSDDVLFDYIINEIAKTEGTGTNDKIQHQRDVNEINTIRTYLRKIFSEGKCLLFIEGLNEISQKDQAGNNISFSLRTQVINNLVDFASVYKDVRYFVTTRISGISTNERGTIGNFKRYDLQPLDDVQILTQINNYNNIVGNSNSRHEYNATDLWNSIRNHEIGELAQNPMQLMQIVELFGKEGIKEEDYDIKLSELFRRLIEERLIKKANFVLPEVKDEQTLVFLVNNLLRIIAKELFENQCRSTDNDHILARKNEILTIPTNTTIEDLLRVATGLFILKKENDEYSFSHDSWQDYYLAFDFAQQVEVCKDDETKLRTTIEQFVSNPENLLKQDIMDILKETFEILDHDWLSGGRKDRDKNIKDIKEKTKKKILSEDNDYYDPDDIEIIRSNEQARLNERIENQIKDYERRTNDARRRMSRFVRMLLAYGEESSKANLFLPVIAYATTSIMDEPCNRDVNTPDDNQLFIQPKELIRQRVSKFLTNYVKKNENGLPDSDTDSKVQINDYLKPIFASITLLSDERLLDAILSPYWFRLWILRPENEEKVFEKKWKKNDFVNVLSGVLIEQSTNLLLLYMKFYELYKRITIMNLPETALQIERFMMRILLKLRDGQIINVIDTLLNQDTDEIEQIINRRLSANALLVLNNVDVMFNKLNDINKSMQKDDIDFEYQFRSGIHLRAASKLITKFGNPKIQELIIGKEWKKDGSLIGLIEDLPIGSDVHLKILSSVFMRHKMIEPDKQAILEKYLISEDGQTVIYHNPWLLDLLPLEKVPTFYKSQYDQEILKFYKREKETHKTKYSVNDEGFYSVYRVHYHEITYQGKLFAAIPQPIRHEEIGQLYMRFNGDGNLFKVKTEKLPAEEQNKYSNRPLLFIENPSGNCNGDGYIEFYLDQDGTYHKSIDYNSLIDIVQINHPELYHTSICEDLVNNCKKSDIKDVFLFCKKKSGIRYILKKYLNQEFNHWEFSLPNVCVVIDSSPAQTHLFSPSQSGIINKFDPKRYKKGSFFSSCPPLPRLSSKYSLAPSSGEDSTSFVVCERNGKISPLDYKKVQTKRGEVLGFVNGTIIQYRQKELAISIKNDLKYVFFIDEGTNKDKVFQVGDKVSFFPSINYRNNILISVALCVEIIN
jgi:ABC-type dipeptide/oligopeptide/nickel transport system ATPase component